MTSTREELIWVHLPWATFGLVVRDDHVTATAPIARYAEGWTRDRALSYFTSRGAEIQRVGAP